MKNVLKAVIMAGCCMATQAALADEWEVKWQGFSIINPGEHYFNPDLIHTAKFSGVDANSDSVISLDELTSLVVAGDNVMSCPWEGDSCGVSAFSYSVSGGVQFSAYFSSSYEDEWSNSIDTDSYGYVTGESFSWDHYGQGSVNEWWVHQFTPQTIETVTLVSSVPEPATYAMFGAGLLLLGSRAARRK